MWYCVECETHNHATAAVCCGVKGGVQEKSWKDRAISAYSATEAAPCGAVRVSLYRTLRPPVFLLHRLACPRCSLLAFGRRSQMVVSVKVICQHTNNGNTLMPAAVLLCCSTSLTLYR